MLDGIQNSSVRIDGVQGIVTSLHGKSCLKCVYKRSHSLMFQALNGSKNVNLLGGNDCVKLGLIARVHVANVNAQCQSIVKKYDHVLGKSIDCLPGEYVIKVD